MKKIFLTMGVVIAFTACKKNEIVPVAAEPTFTKTAVWTIAATADFSQPYYNNSTAEVKLAVSKQLLNPYREVIIWDTTFQRRPLAQFMQLNPYVVTKSFNGIKDSEGKLSIGYSISYITGPLNAQQYSAYGSLIEIGNSTHRVAVNL